MLNTANQYTVSLRTSKKLEELFFFFDKNSKNYILTSMLCVGSYILRAQPLGAVSTYLELEKTRVFQKKSPIFGLDPSQVIEVPFQTYQKILNYLEER